MQLRNTMRVSEDEPTRKAAYEGLRSVGPFVSEALLGIVRDRNKLAKLIGFQDFYDMKVRRGCTCVLQCECLVSGPSLFRLCIPTEQVVSSNFESG